MEVLFTRRHHIGSWMLRSLTWSAWSHCAIVTADLKVIEARAFAGVVERPLDELLSESSRYAKREIQLPDDSAAIAFARSQVGKPYDYAGVIGIGLGRCWEDPSAWYCNELVEAACVAGGRRRISQDAWRVVPQVTWMVA